MKYIAVIFLFISMVAPTALSQNKGETLSCPEALEALKIAEDFKFQLSRNTSLIPCDPKNLPFLTATIIRFFQTITPQLGPGILSAPELTKPYEYFKTRVQRIEFPDDCDPLHSAYVRNEKPGVMHICPKLIGTSKVSGAALFMHEARHLDGMQFRHVQCLSGTVKGTRNCDDSMISQGSYSVQLDFLMRAINSKSLSNFILIPAQEDAIYVATTSFNQIPLFEHGSLLKTSDGEIRFVNQQQNLLITHGDSNSILFNDFLSGSIYDSLRKQVLALRPHKNLHPYPDYDRTLQTYLMNGTEKLQDLMITDSFTCGVYKSNLICTEKGEETDVPFSKFSGLSFFKPRRSLVLEENRIYLVDSQGHLRKLPSSTKNFNELNLDETIVKVPKGLVGTIAVNDDIEIGILTNGDEHIYSKKTGRWSPTGRNLTQGKTVVKVINDVLWTSEHK